MENTDVSNEGPTSNISVILLGLTLFLLLVNLTTYGCSWYGRQPMNAEESSGNKEEYFKQKQPWNTAVFYLLGTSTFITFAQMIIVMWQVWGMRKLSKAAELKRAAAEEAKTFV